MNIGERIKRLRKSKKWTQGDLALRVKIHRSTLADYETGRIENIPPKNIIAIANVFGVSPSYFMDDSEAPPKYTLPVYGNVRAGVPIEAVQNILDYEEVDKSMSDTNEFMALRVVGDSMSPRICEGDVIIIQKTPNVESGQIGVVLIGNETTIKKIKWVGDNLQLIPFNQAYEPLFFSKAEIETLPIVFLGRLVELRGKF